MQVGGGGNVIKYYIVSDSQSYRWNSTGIDNIFVFDTNGTEWIWDAQAFNYHTVMQYNRCLSWDYVVVTGSSKPVYILMPSLECLLQLY